MPSRRQLLAGSGLAISLAAGIRALETPPSTPSSPPAGTDGVLDWPMARFDAAGTGFSPDASGPKDGVQRRWKTEPDSTVVGPAPPIVQAETNTIALTGRRSIIAIAASSGRIRFERSGYSYLTGPTWVEANAYQADTLAVTGNEGVYGLAADGGYALSDISIGLERWHAPGEEPPIRTSATPEMPSLVAANGTIYAVVPETNRIAALDGNSGQIHWTAAIGARRSSQPFRPAVRNGVVYVTASPDHVEAFDAATGDRLWARTLEPADSNAESDGFSYREVATPTATSAGLVVPSREALSLLDPDDGHLEWEYVHNGALTDGSVAVANGTVFLADGEALLHAVSLETGEAQWTTEYRHDVDPVVADGVIYLAYFWLPELVAIDAETGERRWEAEVPAGASQPIVGDGVLYVTVHDTVLALEEGDETAIGTDEGEADD